MNDIKKIDTQLKTLLAIGGWNHGSDGFKEMVDTVETRRSFIQAAISFLRKHSKLYLF